MKLILKKIAEVKREIGKISKDSTNPFFKSKYFDINALLEHVEPLLEKNGLILIQPIERGVVASEIYDIESGESIASSLNLPEIADPQKIGSCISYYRRYTLQSLLAIQAEDDDANKTITTPSQQISKPNEELPWLNHGTKEWDNAVSKRVTVFEVREHYKLSKANEVLYLKEIG